jgi:hypothetical protein
MSLQNHYNELAHGTYVHSAVLRVVAVSSLDNIFVVSNIILNFCICVLYLGYILKRAGASEQC